MGGYPFLMGQPPQYGSQTYRSERMGDPRGPSWQHREQMTAPLLFVVGPAGGHLQGPNEITLSHWGAGCGPRVATYDVNELTPALGVRAEGDHIGCK